MSHQTFPKPRRGDALLERRTKRAATVKAEQAEMQAALKRDGRKCRWPGCAFGTKSIPLPVDACHLRHRGMGGNPTRDRTTRQGIIALCRGHHGLLDAAEIQIEPCDVVLGTDGPVVFFLLHPDGIVRQWARERTVCVVEHESTL